MTNMIRCDGSTPRLPPKCRDIEELVISAIKLRNDIAMAAFRPSVDLLRRMDLLITDMAGQAKVIAAASPGTDQEVIAHLGFLMMSFANAGVSDAKVYGRLMADDVLSLKPSAAAVEIACRTWRQTSRFLPAISEIMTAVKSEQDALTSAVDFLKTLPELRDRMQRDLVRES